ncbi:hypothetical protein F4808DRAFT_435363 [Astrocystis sublimbata]|nr:hypothetical protein F4808DRAFT_435363 [Astrocystis sublimbata]
MAAHHRCFHSRSRRIRLSRFSCIAFMVPWRAWVPTLPATTHTHNLHAEDALASVASHPITQPERCCHWCCHIPKSCTVQGKEKREKFSRRRQRSRTKRLYPAKVATMADSGDTYRPVSVAFSLMSKRPCSNHHILLSTHRSSPLCWDDLGLRYKCWQWRNQDQDDVPLPDRAWSRIYLEGNRFWVCNCLSFGVGDGSC